VGPEPETLLPPAPPPRGGEEPPCSGWTVLAIAILTFTSFLVLSFVLFFLAQRFFYRGETLAMIAERPLVGLIAQGVTYLFVLACMIIMVKGDGNRGFWQTIRWNWPSAWWTYLGAGVILTFALGFLEHFLKLPMPKDQPFDRFLQNAQVIWILVLFGTTLGPFMEELFFRGLLYPVLVNRIGVYGSIFFTALGFGLIHLWQYGRGWGPVLVVFLVGIALTTVRAVTKSVAASLLVHMAYNGTIFAVMYIATDGFRHLEKLSQ
jgi:uncharacterized protein